uniref:Uncharacterized protein n=1 Tax=Cucumis sativus TaxID=3659 RepID=A0A0A0KYU5_CUCSA
MLQGLLLKLCLTATHYFKSLMLQILSTQFDLLEDLNLLIQSILIYLPTALLPHSLASRIFSILSAESRARNSTINTLTERRSEVDYLIRHFKALLPSSSTTNSSEE